MKRYEFFGHTADIAVKAYGGSLKELFTSSALAMFSILVSKKQNRPETILKEVIIKKTEEALEDLVKAWLDELLFYFSSQCLILHRIKSLDICEGALEAKVLFETFDKDYFQTGQEIKAVTYHELKVERIRNKWQAHIIFDV
ncbi:MAG: archease [Candidatus Omnitrophica bacterium]|nr:archease [Candidatus Omnitrophota bacterium]